MNICVYCSSSNFISEIHFNTALELGKWLAENGHSVVYGGASVGLMEALAKSFKAHTPIGKLIGVIPEKIIDMGLTTNLADEIITVSDMKERKDIMRSMGDGFIAMPGSFGTLDEIIEEIVLHQLNYHEKPVVFYDPHNFYSFLYQQFDRFFAEGFIQNDYRKLYSVATTSKELGIIFNKANNLV